MYRQKSFRRTIAIFILLLQQSVFGTDFKSCRLVADINGCVVKENIILKDKDQCSVFIVNEDGKRVTVTDDYAVTWNICFFKDEINYKKQAMNSETPGKVDFTVTPPFMGFDFGEGTGASISLWFETTQTGFIECNIENHTGGKKLATLHLPIKIDVLPHVNDFRVAGLYYEEIEGIKFPVVVFDINISDYNEAKLLLCDERIPEGYCFIYIAKSELLNGKYTLDNTYEGDFYRMQVYNDYGCIVVGPIYADWYSLCINENTMNDRFVDVKIHDNICGIRSHVRMKDVKIFDINGHLCFCDKEKKEIAVTLNKGIYIITVVTDNNIKTTRKIII